MDPNAQNIDRDLAECRELALEVSGGTATTAVRNTAVGAVGGAAVGTVLGALSGEAGEGAKVGTALGGVAGGVTGAFGAEEDYKTSYIKCMEGRGHKVLNPQYQR
jgi:uncharacterized protein YcfJ